MEMENERLTGRPWDKWRVVLDSSAPKTKRNYLDEFLPFLEWTNLNTQTLYDLFIETEFSQDRLDRGAVRDKILEYLNYIDKRRVKEKGKPYSASKKRMVVNAVKSFFASCDEELKMNGRTPKVKKSGGSKIFTKDQLKHLVPFVQPGNYRDFSIVYTARDSGLRISDVSNIQLKHVIDVLKKPGQEFHQFTICQEKTGEDAYPIIGPDAVMYLRLWLRQREDLGFSNNDPEAFLYVNLQDNADYVRNGKLIKGSKRGDKIDSGNITRLFTQLVERADLQGKKLSAHSLRKYHSSRTVVGGLSESMMKTLQGKDLGDSMKPYMDFTPDELMERYKQAYNELTLNKTIEVEREEVEKLKEQLTNLTQEMATLQARTWNVSKMAMDDDPRIKQYVDLWMQANWKKLGIPEAPPTIKDQQEEDKDQ